MRYVTTPETPWPPRDAIAVVGDGTGYTIYQAGDSVPGSTAPGGLPDDGSPSVSITASDLLDGLASTGLVISAEKLGLSPTNSADLNASRLEALTLYDAPAPTTILFPSGKSYPLGLARLQGKGVSLMIEGEVVQSGPILVGCGKTAYKVATSNCYLGSRITGNGRLRAADANALTTGIQFQYAGDFDVVGLRFADHGKHIEFLDPAADAYNQAYVDAGNSATYWLAQANRQIRIVKNRFRNGKYIVYSNALDPNLTMFANADSEFNDNFALGTRWIKHLLVRGFDGWTQRGNWLFMAGFTLQDTEKEQNCYINRCTNVISTGNEFYEAGLEGVLVDGVTKFTSLGDKVIQPGQKQISFGFRFTGGNHQGGSDCEHSIDSEVEYASGGTVRVDTTCQNVKVEAFGRYTGFLDSGPLALVNPNVQPGPDAVAVSALTIPGGSAFVLVDTSPVAHGLRSGQSCLLLGVGGATQANRKRFQVQRVSPTQFRLFAEKGVGWSAYTSGGYVVPLFGVDARGYNVGIGDSRCDVTHAVATAGSQSGCSRGHAIGGAEVVPPVDRALEVNDAYVSAGNSDAIIDIFGYDTINFSRTAAHTVTAFSYCAGFDIESGRRIKLRFFNGNSTIQHQAGGALRFSTGSNLVGSADLVVTLEYYAGVWRRVA